MKILLVAEAFPWPPTGGGLLRSAQIFGALAELGSAELFSLHDGRRSSFEVPDHIRVTRVGSAPSPALAHGPYWRARWLLRGGVPLEVAMRRADPAPRRAFERWAADTYDLVWFSTAAAYDWLGRPRLGPTVIDLDDLEEVKSLQRGSVLRSSRTSGSSWSRLRSGVAAFQATVNSRDWRSFDRSIADQVDTVVLCSQADAERSALSNVVVVPNTYPVPEHPAGRIEVGDPPVVLFQGRLNYAPNMDAVEWLLDDVAPSLWAQMPRIQIRLVGRATPAIEFRSRPPAVTVVGGVPAMEPELGRADLCVVPLRMGSGTRLKILEAFAHRVPVVSTSVGADGLDVRDGVHLLVADDPEAFASACRRLLTDPGLRARMAEAADALFRSRYQSAVVNEAVARLVDGVIARSSGAPPGQAPASARRPPAISSS